jgi:hypothetical protein
MVKLTWAELSQSQKDEFVKQMQFAGDKNTANYPKHIYQIKDGKCHGWVYFGTIYSKPKK